IGMATAQVLANRGHSVVATDRSAPSGLEGIQAHVLDVTSDDSVARCLEEVGPLDAIVNNAGIAGGGPVEGYPLDGFRQMFETNTLGPLRVIQAVLPAWRKRGSGVIVNVSSQVDDFSALLLPNRITPQWQSSAPSAPTSPAISTR
ncbi:MAG: SDR family NAD(P)-dependent oxidoreductase, partial [Actinobacteria bacterium]|nr:SDR family NAD(P)-dependent oxidoreductase [Actinomycetota bacterium]